MSRKTELQEKIAYESAADTVSSFCVPHTGGWYEILEDMAELPEANYVNEAVEYLRILGHIEDHPKRKWIRVAKLEHPNG
jgi:hypothetical protein